MLKNVVVQILLDRAQLLKTLGCVHDNRSKRRLNSLLPCKVTERSHVPVRDVTEFSSDMVR